MNIDIKHKTTLRLPVSLSGIVIPTEWDESGNHTAIALAADDEREYRINTENKKGKLLQQLLRMRVRIDGYLDPYAVDENSKAILVNSYQILENNQV